MSVKKLLRKLKKTYAKMLSAYARRKLAKAYELEDKAILLELELKDRKLRDEIDEGLTALDKLFKHDEKHGLYDDCLADEKSK